MFVKCGWGMNWRNDPHTSWIISAIVLYLHPKNIRHLQQDLNPWPLQSHHRGHGFESCWRQRYFSGANMRQSLRLSSKCEDHFFNNSYMHYLCSICLELDGVYIAATSSSTLRKYKKETFHCFREPTIITPYTYRGFAAECLVHQTWNLMFPSWSPTLTKLMPFICKKNIL